MTACPYQIRIVGETFFVIRPVLSPRPGGERFFTVAGPFGSRYEAEAVAKRRWAGEGRRAA